MPDPVFKLQTGFGVKRPAGSPQILDNVDDVDDDCQVEVVFTIHSAQPKDLRFVAIDQCHPDFLILRISMAGFEQRLFNDLFGLFFETGPHTLLLRTGAWRSGTGGATVVNQLLGCSHKRRNCVDSRHGGHTLGIFLFPFGQPCAHFVCARFGGFPGLLPQVLSSHRSHLCHQR